MKTPGSTLLKWTLALTLLLTAGLTAHAAITLTQPENGDGSPASPYELKTAGDLYWFADQVNNQGAKTACAKLMNDIVVNTNVLNSNGDLNEGTFEPWIPIGFTNSSSQAYQGSFDGQGHFVSGLYFNNTNSTSQVGLFGYITEATIKNVGIKDSYFNADRYVGAICGRSHQNSIISQCYNESRVRANFYSGGICGFNRVGNTVSDCFNGGWVSHSYSGYGYVGGIVGENGGTISNCYSIGAVYDTGSTSIGNANTWIGYITGSNSSEGTIINCCYVENTPDENQYQGIASTSSYRAKEAYLLTPEQFANGEATWLLNNRKSEAPEGESLVWYQTLNGTDAVPVWDNRHAVVYRGYQNGCEPYYSNTLPTQTNPIHQPDENDFCEVCHRGVPGLMVGDVYEIATVGNLYGFAQEVNEGNSTCKAKLTNNIVVNPQVLNADGALNGDGSSFREWTPIGAKGRAFEGEFDGQGYTVSGLFYDQTYEQTIGFFGTLNRAVVQNLGVVDTYFRGWQRVGGLFGHAAYDGRAGYKGSITNCYSHASIRGDNRVGVFGGCTETDWMIEQPCILDCYSKGTVTYTNYYGITYANGFIAHCIDGLINNCYTLAQSFENDYSVATEVPEADFKSGKVAWLLNGSKAVAPEGETLAWYQTLGPDGDKAPVLVNTGSNTVYEGYICERFGYFNDPTYVWPEPREHAFGEGSDVKCDRCDTWKITCFPGTLNVICREKAGSLQPLNDDETLVTYRFLGISEGSLMGEAASAFEAGQPFLYQPAGNAVLFTADDYSDEVNLGGDENGLYGLLANNNNVISNGGNNYIVFSKKGIMYTPANGNVTVPFHKGYVKVDEACNAMATNASAAPIKLGSLEVATALDAAEQESLEAAEAYNLQGMRVTSDYQGIVVINGTKILNK